MKSGSTARTLQHPWPCRQKPSPPVEMGSMIWLRTFLAGTRGQAASHKLSS